MMIGTPVSCALGESQIDIGREPSSIAAEPQEALSGMELTASVFFPT
jgi:hypothetical protein